MNKYKGKERKKIKTSIKALEYQKIKFGLTIDESNKLTELNNKLKSKLCQEKLNYVAGL